MALTRKNPAVRFLFALVWLYAVGNGLIPCTPARAETFPNFSNGGGGDWMGGYRHPLLLTNRGDTDLTDHQILIRLSPHGLGNPYQHVKAGGSDIRFTGHDAKTEIPHWIESYDNTFHSRIWVKVPKVPRGRSRIYMYYGNPAANPGSDGPATFEFFDDFSAKDGAAPDPAKWTVTDPPAVIIGNKLRMGKRDDPSALTLRFSPTLPYVIEYDYKPVADGSQASGLLHTLLSFDDEENPIQLMFGHRYSEDSGRNQMRLYEDRMGTLATSINLAAAHGKTFRIGIVVDNKGKRVLVRVDRPDFLKYNGSARTFIPRPISMETCQSQEEIDRFRVRKYARQPAYLEVHGPKELVANCVHLTPSAEAGADRAGVEIGKPFLLLRFDLQLESKANPGRGIAHWKRLRIDKYVPPRSAELTVPDEEITLTVWAEANDNGRWDAGDAPIARSSFREGKIWFNMKRTEITTVPRTFYVVGELALDTSPGRIIGVEIWKPEFFEFAEKTLQLSQVNFGMITYGGLDTRRNEGTEQPAPWDFDPEALARKFCEDRGWQFQREYVTPASRKHILHFRFFEVVKPLDESTGNALILVVSSEGKADVLHETLAFEAIEMKEAFSLEKGQQALAIALCKEELTRDYRLWAPYYTISLLGVSKLDEGIRWNISLTYRRPALRALAGPTYRAKEGPPLKLIPEAGASPLPSGFEFSRKVEISHPQWIKIQELIALLGDERWDVREKATQDLLAFGRRATSLLKEALRHPDLEVRRRAKYLLKRMK
ncbi:MAG: DUF2341 domain-containing protein [Planctomycetota bacterium]|jgi:hypothetical protein